MATLLPENHAEFSIAEIVSITSGVLKSRAFGQVTGVTTDSRADVSGKLFVALRGERYDAHDFVVDAVRAGAAAVIVEHEVPPLGVPTIRVASSLAALADLAHAHRQRWAGALVAVAGSAGKTTTRSAVSALLAACSSVHYVRGNLNNRVGVPLVLLGLSAEHRYAVVEIGTNQRGEVRDLARTADPNVGVLTLVAHEHSEGLGDLDEVESEEGDLFRALGSASVAIGNLDDVRVRRQLALCPTGRRIGYGRAEGADYRLLERQGDGLGGSDLVLERGGERLEVACPLLGEAGAYAVLAALAASEAALGRALSRQELGSALGSAELAEGGRLVPVELGDGTIVLDDTYNANPASVKSSIATAREIARARDARLILVLGEMRELGKLSHGLHAELGDDIAESGAVVLVAVSGDAELFVEPARRRGLDAVFARDSQAALGLVLDRVRPRDVVLVKASRGVRAEGVVSGLAHALGPRSGAA
jgi:UDP-N-acetylmuramoyl-tripeptide--D-alanyl-D-alanine ligase